MRPGRRAAWAGAHWLHQPVQSARADHHGADGAILWSVYRSDREHLRSSAAAQSDADNLICCFVGHHPLYTRLHSFCRYFVCGRAVPAALTCHNPVPRPVPGRESSGRLRRAHTTPHTPRVTRGPWRGPPRRRRSVDRVAPCATVVACPSPDVVPGAPGGAALRARPRTARAADDPLLSADARPRPPRPQRHRGHERY